MSVAGLKNKFAKAGQYMSEKVLKAEHTRKDEEYQEMEKAVDAMSTVAEHMMRDVNHVLQPNPTERMKVIAKKRVKSDKAFYPYEEGPLGDVMLKASGELAERAGSYSSGLEAVGNAMRELADERDDLTVRVGQNFIEPVTNFITRDVKEITAHRKKMESRRLNFDAKRRKLANAKGGNAGVTEEEVRDAEAKFDESYELAANSMQNLLESEDEQLGYLRALCEAFLESHQRAQGIFENAMAVLDTQINEAASRPRREVQATAKKAEMPSRPTRTSATATVGQSSEQDEPHCVALYDFEPENAGELGFSEGDVIVLVNKIDDNWLEGSLHGQVGHFPTNYVEVRVAL